MQAPENHPDHIGVVAPHTSGLTLWAVDRAARRARLIAGLAPWADARPAYRLRLGAATLPFDVLSDDALADLRSRIAADVRRERARRG